MREYSHIQIFPWSLFHSTLFPNSLSSYARTWLKSVSQQAKAYWYKKTLVIWTDWWVGFWSIGGHSPSCVQWAHLASDSDSLGAFSYAPISSLASCIFLKNGFFQWAVYSLAFMGLFALMGGTWESKLLSLVISRPIKNIEFPSCSFWLSRNQREGWVWAFSNLFHQFLISLQLFHSFMEVDSEFL